MEVTAADFVRHFAKYRDDARVDPVVITTHGRGTHVLCALEDYERLNQAPAASMESDGSANLAYGLADWVEEAIVICDADLRIVFINRVAGSLMRAPGTAQIGMPLLEAFPALEGSLIEMHLRQTLSSGEPSSGDIASPFRPDAWLRLQCFDLGNLVAIKMRDITEGMQRYLMADIKQAIMDAMNAHGDISYVRLSIRGTIERTDEPFCELVGLGEERLIGVPFTSLVHMPTRVTVGSQIDRVILGEGTTVGKVSLLTNRGEVIATKAAITRLNSATGAEGAVILMTRIGE